MGLKRKAIRNIGIITVTQVFGKIVTIISTLILARMLLPYDFGIVAIGLLIVGFLEQFRDFGIGAAIVQRKDNVEDALNTAFTMRVILSIILFTAAFFMAPIMAMFFGEPVITKVAQITAIVILLGSISFAPETMLTKNIKFKILGAIEVLRAVTYAVVAISLALNGFSYWSIVYGFLLSFSISAISLWIIAPQKIKFSFNKKIAKEIIRFGGFIFGVNIIAFIIMNVDNALIGKVLSISILGYYILAYRWGLWATYFPGIVSRVTFPTYSKIQNNIKKLKEGYLKTAEYVGFLSIPLAIGLCAIASLFIPIIVGEKWNPAIPALEVLCISGIFTIFSMIAAQILLAIGKPSVTFSVNLCRLIIILVFIYPAMLWQGIFGVAIIVAISTFVQTIIMNYSVCKSIQTSWLSFIQSIAPAFISSLIMFIVVFLSKIFLPSTFIILLGLIGLGIIIYVASLYLITKGEIVTKIKEITSALKSKSES